MKIIVPMAGRGSRLRPHTLTIPKPLMPVAGKPIVHRLVEDITKVSNEKVDEIAFIIGDFGDETEKQLLEIAESLGAKGSIYHQEEALGTAHAILCAGDSLDGNVVVAFADTLFKADFTLDTQNDGIIWVNQIDNPSAFGVVKLDEEGTITDFVEKPKEFVSDLAIIGIYYFKDGKNLRAELQHLIDSGERENGEYQITNVLENMKSKGAKFKTGKVSAWMDCGNKNITVDTNKRVLDFEGKNIIEGNFTNNNSVIIEPCFIGDNVTLTNSVVGPHVSIGNNTTIVNSVIDNSIIQNHAHIEKGNMTNSMIGNYAKITGNSQDLSVGDYTEMK
ncbi:sugar phosphate nucleotidyltransferase [Flavobacteriales bacterium]|jgi:glucose-1-phosphate thymidylyltransferase|nr:sugar phosphate nucleotidyltransferase [Flavobacteriales bacterium]MDB9931642.1 sugar phosphate nucleotidyltransferase [Flavobacteriales bacterium]MDC1370698.1 sugar phosphate nucleotidyltransferase [Flavobacteriales bacterium]MDG1174914.1 sugar phosphate nucleotidyltransferase [Flavobacteriales bacterium]|tara:strand:- start:186 stop:1184 length:999 start_codon:yes stop_codon:yes gene_type:complete